MKRDRGGFTLLELLIFAAMFTITATSFITILLAMTRVQLRQEGSAEVAQQSQFLLQSIQRYVEQSSMIELTADSSTSTLKLRMASSTYDPTYIYPSGGALYIKETDAGTPQRLTSAKVTVTDIQFVKRQQAGGHDSVSIGFTLSYNAPNPQSKFAQALRTSITRVSAATFDSNVIPSANNTYKLGTAAGDWQSINSTIYFSGSNVGIGVASPGSKLQITSGDVYIDTIASGLIQRSANGTCWRIAVSNAGALSAASTTCP
jgi:type II secretory pathway pseudopilin PulG